MCVGTALTGAELFGKDAIMPRGGTYLKLAINTYDEVWEQWDTESCGGGIYWSRNRRATDNLRTYKSTITNAQQINMAARLSILTGNATYNQHGEMVYAWLKSSGLVTADWRVLDGANAPNCATPNRNELSYKIGTLVGALGWLFKSTGKTQYQTEAGLILDVALRQFAPNNIFTDPCEAANPTCPANQVSPKGTMIRGLMYLYMTTTDAAIKAKIATAVDASFLAMAAAACDEKWNCGNVWQGAGARVYTDFHTQLNALELANAVAVVHPPAGVPGAVAVTAPTTASSGTKSPGADQSAKSAADGRSVRLSSVLLIVALATVMANLGG
ncbi:glycosyl hydrolase family 76-domain-containing protein [Entophlyctis helioformis]|nr:glycosyl hydrolase family 76-domain-containing protein [Entophlyctis helioformis]